MTISLILAGHSQIIHQASPTDLVSNIAGKLAKYRIGALPVTQNGQVLGIFSERDLVYGAATYGNAIFDKQVNEVMTAPAIMVTPDTAVLAALSVMTKRRIRHLPVVENGTLTGFVSIGDLVKFRIEKIEREAAAMRDYIQMA